MSLPFEMDPPVTERPTIIQIHADPDTNLSGFVRLHLTLTQEELADRAGCSFETIQNIERGVTPVSRKMARRLLGLLPRGVRLTWLGLPYRGRPQP